MTRLEPVSEDVRKQILDSQRSNIFKRYRNGEISSERALEELKKLTQAMKSSKDVPHQGTMFL